MKKYVYVFILMGFLLSCSNSHENEARKRIEMYISENAHDPNSYEFIKIDLPDTLTISDTLLISLKSDSADLWHFKDMENSSRSTANHYKEKKNDKYFGIGAEEGEESFLKEAEYYRNKAAEKSASIQEKINTLEKLSKDPVDKQILSVTYTLNFRIKNLMGAYSKTFATINYYPANDKWGVIEIEPTP